MRKLMMYCLIVFVSQVYGQSYVSKLKDFNQFKSMSNIPLSTKYSGIKAVKVVYDLQKKELYFLNGKRYKYHYEFCMGMDVRVRNLEKFNRENYSNCPQRKYLLGNLNYLQSKDVYVLEISPVDAMSYGNIVRLYDIVTESVGESIELKFLLNSLRLRNLKDSLVTEMAVIEPSEVYHGLVYQAIGRYDAYGNLKIINDLKKEFNSIQPTDIIVLKNTPIILPPVAGVIVNEFQTPLSHLMILAKNRSIPIVAYKGIFDDPSLRAIENHPVLFQVRSDTFLLSAVNSSQVKSKPPSKVSVKYDLSQKDLIRFNHDIKKGQRFIGMKAHNFGELVNLSLRSDFLVPESAFAIPFSFYDNHVRVSGVQARIDSLLSNRSSLSRSDVNTRLKEIRSGIKTFDIDDALLQCIRHIAQESGYTSFRFRSSTNAEDLKGFSGAGLYASKTGVIDSENKPIQKAIASVWASLWSEAAYWERELYQIDHRDVYMGILVHRSFPNEAVNGVAVTRNLYRPSLDGFTVNAQIGEVSVVIPDSGVTTDQFICYPQHSRSTMGTHNPIEVISTSSFNLGKLVMNGEEIKGLANSLEDIKSYFFDTHFSTQPYNLYGLDVEFKLDGEERKLYIKQVREY